MRSLKVCGSATTIKAAWNFLKEARNEAGVEKAMNVRGIHK